jgi:hypothetical protein
MINETGKKRHPLLGCSYYPTLLLASDANKHAFNQDVSG